MASEAVVIKLDAQCHIKIPIAKVYTCTEHQRNQNFMNSIERLSLRSRCILNLVLSLAIAALCYPCRKISDHHPHLSFATCYSGHCCQPNHHCLQKRRPGTLGPTAWRRAPLRTAPEPRTSCGSMEFCVYKSCRYKSASYTSSLFFLKKIEKTKICQLGAKSRKASVMGGRKEEVHNDEAALTVGDLP